MCANYNPVANNSHVMMSGGFVMELRVLTTHGRYLGDNS